MPLHVSVTNGDLSFVAQPLLIGHYRALRLTGAEKVMNSLIGRSMERSLALGRYPNELGTPQIFLNTHRDAENPWRLPRPKAVVVVGLGAEGELTTTGLADAVYQAVIAWVQHIADQSGLPNATEPAEVGLAGTLIGSGGSGISAGQSAQSVVQGVCLANERIEELKRSRAFGTGLSWPSITALTLIELYLDRATEAWRALRLHLETDPRAYSLDDSVRQGQGSLKRPAESGYRGADYDFISALADPGTETQAAISYSLDTRRARTEVKGKSVQAAAIRSLVSGSARADAVDDKVGHTLFRLLVPADIQPFFAGTAAIVLEVNRGSAGIPWELLNTAGPDNTEVPWALRSKVLRKLRTRTFTTGHDADVDASFLIIGEPACDDPDKYPRLPAAAEEARRVEETLTEAGIPDERITALISPPGGKASWTKASKILNALIDKDWRVVHISGHGATPVDGISKGVVLSDNVFLGSCEIASIPAVPELVFVNCCFLAAKDEAQLLAGEHSRPEFAANVAESLIDLGVRCVIAAGWAVDDEPAAVFSSRFYERLVKGDRFIDAVSAARRASYDTLVFGRRSNTWAAYQCYGDPDWTLRPGTVDTTIASALDPKQEFAGLASIVALKDTLETIAVESKWQRKDLARQRQRVAWLEDRFGDRWGTRGDVAEVFGLARSEIGDRSKARDWYQRASNAPDATASLKATEQLANLMSRVAWEDVCQARSSRRRKAAAEGRKAIGKATALLDTLIELTPTSERESIYGSAFKRLAMLESITGRPREAGKAVREMRKHYRRAEEIALENHGDVFYPAMNRLVADLSMIIHGAPLKEFVRNVEALRTTVHTRDKEDPDFWTVAAKTELSMYKAIAEQALTLARAAIETEFGELFERVSAERMWASVYDNAMFVLPLYAAVAARQERAAAAALLKALKGLVKRAQQFERTASSDRSPGKSESADGSAEELRESVSRGGVNVKKPAAKRVKKAAVKKAKRAATVAKKTTATKKGSTRKAPRPTPATARAFVRGVSIPTPRRTRGGPEPASTLDAAFNTAKNEAAVVGSNVISFVQGVTPERRQAIINSSLLAQLVAKTKVPDSTQIKAWYDAYFDVLANIGWVIQDRSMAEYKETGKNFEAHKAIISVATALMGAAPAALALVKTTLEALHSMNEGSPWITIFDRETRQSKTAHFQVGLAEQDPAGQFFVTIMAFGLEAQSKVTQVLFFKAKATDVTLHHYSGKVTIDTSVLDSVQAEIAAKLAGHASNFVKKLPDFNI